MRDLHGRHHDQRRQAVRQQMAEQDARRRQRETRRGLDILLVALDQCGAAHGARVVSPLHRDERDHDLVHTLAEHREQDQRDQDGRKRKLDVHEPHDHSVDPAAEPGGGKPDREPDRERGERRYRADAEADAQAVENRRQQVASLVVAAEPERQAVDAPAAGSELGVEDVEFREIVRILRRDQGCAERDDQDQYENSEAGEREPARGEIGGDAPERRFDGRSRGFHVGAPVRRTRGSRAE